MPATRDPGVLAAQVEHVAAILQRGEGTRTESRRAAEFHQLAVHTLATTSDAFRQQVMSSLSPEAAVATRSDVRAARSLHEMTTPQPTLPSWRVVPPAPAADLLGYYQEAERRIGVPWTYLAAIHLVETRMGRIRGTSTAGALGPMQFLPSTWELYGGGGDIHNSRDAILAAARLLKDHGAPDDIAGALLHYNPSANYVRAVSEHARTLSGVQQGGVRQALVNGRVVDV